jgi:hypothetical protein
MKWISAALVVLCLNACGKGDEVWLSGPSMLDSTGAALTPNGSLRNVEKARIVAVVELLRAVSDTCGSPSVQLTANVEMSDGQRVVLIGHGASACNAERRPITETIDLRYAGAPESMPRGTIRSIKMRSLQPVTVRSVEWQTWQQGI